MDRNIEKKLAEERNEPEALEEELERVRGGHREWADEKAGDAAEGANPEAGGAGNP
jgi:hypothetical protein